MKNNHHKHVTKEELEQSLSGLEQRMAQKFVTKEELEQSLAGLEQRMARKFVTKEELEQSLAGLEQRIDRKMDQKMDRFATREELAKAETHIVCWVVGLFLGTVVLIGTLVGVYATLLLGKL